MNSQTSPFWGTAVNSCHQVRVFSWQACHLTHAWGAWKDGSGITDQLGWSPLLPVDSVPDRNSHMCESRTGRSPRSPPAGWDQSTVSSKLLDSEKQSSPSMGCVRSTVSVVPPKSLDREGESSPSTCQDQSADLRVVSGLKSKLVSLKVTHHLGHIGLGESICLLAASVGWPPTRGVCSWGLTSGHLLWFLEWPWLLECLLLPDCHWLPNHLLLWLPCSPCGLEQLSHSMWPLGTAAAASAWWW